MRSLSLLEIYPPNQCQGFRLTRRMTMKSLSERAETLFNAALRAEEQRDFNKALRLYHQVRKIKRSSPMPWFCIASVLFEQGRWAQAVESARRVIKGWPDWSHLDLVYVIIGQSHLEQNHLRRAKHAFEQSLAVKPKAGTWVFLSDALGRLGHGDESMDCLKEALKLDRNYEEA